MASETRPFGRIPYEYRSRAIPFFAIGAALAIEVFNVFVAYTHRQHLFERNALIFPIIIGLQVANLCWRALSSDRQGLHAAKRGMEYSGRIEMFYWSLLVIAVALVYVDFVF